MTIWRRIRRYGELVMWSHSLFSFSFLAVAAFSAAGGWPRLWETIWLIGAFLGARTCANALNRLIDKTIDATNPRTARRHLPLGTVSELEAWLITAASFGLLAVSAFLLRPWCLAFLPLLAGLFWLYSYSKRWTWLSHWLLGTICAGAPLGAWLALRGQLDWPVLVLAAANCLWVAAFDIIYAIQDIDFDRSNALKSVPARFGQAWSLVIAAACQVGSLSALGLFAYSLGLGRSFYLAIGLIGLLLALATTLAAFNYQKFKTFAAYTVNKIVSLILLAAGLIDIAISGRQVVWTAFYEVLNDGFSKLFNF